MDDDFDELDGSDGLDISFDRINDSTLSIVILVSYNYVTESQPSHNRCATGVRPSQDQRGRRGSIWSASLENGYSFQVLLSVRVAVALQWSIFIT